MQDAAIKDVWRRVSEGAPSQAEGMRQQKMSDAAIGEVKVGPFGHKLWHRLVTKGITGKHGRTMCLPTLIPDHAAIVGPPLGHSERCDRVQIRRQSRKPVRTHRKTVLM